MKFKDKVTLVTGGACGLGRAIARCFAKEGALVIILDKAEEEAGNTAREIESQGGKAVALKVDATQGQEVINVVAKIAEKWGRIDILVNNIGWNECISFLETEDL